MLGFPFYPFSPSKTMESMGNPVSPLFLFSRIGSFRSLTGALLALIIFTSGWVQALRGQAQQFFVSDFETGAIQPHFSGGNDAWGIQGDCLPYAINVVQEAEMGAPAPRAGNYMARFEIRPNDTLCFNRPRAELNSASTVFDVGNDYWLGCSFYLPSPAPSGDIHAILQFHFGSGAGLTPAQIKISDGNQIYYNGGVGVPNSIPVSVDRDVWNDLVMSVRYTFDSDGYVKIWLNGTVIHDYTGPTLGCAANGSGCAGTAGARKMGLYSGGEFNFDSPVVLFIDEYRFGSEVLGYTAGYHGVNPVTYSSQNSTPITTDDSYAAARGESVSVSAPGILSNDFTFNGENAMVLVERGPEHGTLVLDSDGSFSYTPNSGFSGIDSFQYVLSVGGEVSNIATVDLEIETYGDLEKYVFGVWRYKAILS